MSEPTKTERAVNMPEFWEDGSRRVPGNAFCGAYWARGEAAPTVIPPKRGPKAVPTAGQKPPVLAGTHSFDSRGRQSVDLAPRTQGAISITPFDPTRAGRLKASI